MTYRGSMPFNGQQDQYAQNMQPNGFDGWDSPQPQFRYQDAMVAPPDAYSDGNQQLCTQPQQQSRSQPHHHQQHRPLPPHQHHQHRHHVQHVQQVHNANYQQFQSYNPSFDQRPYQQPPSPIVNFAQGGQLQPSIFHQHTQQQPHQQHHENCVPSHHNIRPQLPSQQQQQQQSMDWQYMPPPMPTPMPTHAVSYQDSQSPTIMTTIHTQARPSPTSRNQARASQQLSSSGVVRSPQISSPLLPANHSRNSGSTIRAKQANRVSASPRLTSQGMTRSPSVSSTRSPAPTPGLMPQVDTNSLLICLAEEFFAKARKETRVVSETMDSPTLHEYQKLVATGLGCLEICLGNNKLSPRLEARIRLRYANILCEETNNVMEAETALTKGITLCERNRFADLKYLMQFLQVKLLFSQHKERAAMIVIDGRIRDAEILKHTHWIYAFRFLKASFYLQSANPTEAQAFENFKAILTLASARGDRAVFVVASLVEGFSLLKVIKDDTVVRVQACIAQASKYQLEDTVHIQQLEILALMLDLACSLYQKSPQAITQKMKNLQDRIDTTIKDTGWGYVDTQLLLPIRKLSSNMHVISNDTSGIIKPGPEDHGHDYLALSFWGKLEAFSLTYMYSGLSLLYRQPRNDARMFELWDEALGQLQKYGPQFRGLLPTSLQEAIRNRDWRREFKCYLQILRGLHFATSTRWVEVKKCLEEVEKLKPTHEGVIGLYSMYLSGIYHQGTGRFDVAWSIYNNDAFCLEIYDPQDGSQRSVENDVCLLAAFNRVWMMQDLAYRDDASTLDLIEHLRPMCSDHPNLEIRTAFNLVLAAVQTNPPIPMTAVKTHISTAINNAKILGDVQTLSIALNLMRAKLFQSIVGDQALKSAKAASTQAKRSGNVLWMSVADGMLAQSYDVQGQSVEAQKAWQEAVKYRKQALREGEDIKSDEHIRLGEQ